VEHRRARPDQEAAGRGPAAAAEAQVRPRWHAAHRPGQVVSGRAAAALGAGLLLAQGRRAGLADEALFGNERDAYGRADGRRALHPHPGREARRRAGARPAGPRGRLLLSVAGGAAAGQRRPLRQQAEGPGRARPHCAHLQPGAGSHRRLRAAPALGRAATREQGGGWVSGNGRCATATCS
jgi:hypothetical protein